MPPLWIIGVIGGVLLAAMVVPGVYLWRADRETPLRKSDLGLALISGTLIAFTVLGLQILVELRANEEDKNRQLQSEQESLLLTLGRSPDLSGLDLSRKKLAGSYLKGKVLDGADLTEAAMEDVNLEDASLRSALLVGAQLEGARLDRANLTGADLSGANLRSARLRSAILDGATLAPRVDGDRTTKVDLSDADLSNADLRADLRRAMLNRANLYGAHLNPVNLAGADLSEANVEFADFREANLQGTNLARALNVDYAKDFSFATYDRRTRWPAGFVWPGLVRPCAKPVCTLGPGTRRVFPEQLRKLRAGLASFTRDDRAPYGWRTERADALGIRLTSGGEQAGLIVRTAYVEDLTAEAWANTFPRTSPVAIPGISVEPPISKSCCPTAYAERFVDEKLGTVVAVYFVQARRGYRVWGYASPDVFPLFQRDFRGLFNAVGIKGTIFARLADD